MGGSETLLYIFKNDVESSDIFLFIAMATIFIIGFFIDFIVGSIFRFH
jgi:TRAP-type mannitol/chloroaromatic compound transport system permease large subunit